MFVATNYPSSGNARVFLGLGFVALFLSFTSVGGLPPAQASSTRVDQGETPPNAEADIHERRITKRIRPGDRLPRLLEDLRVPRAARERWLRAVGERVDAAKVLGEGDTAVFYFAAAWGSPGPGRMTAFRVERAGAEPRTWQLEHDRIVYHRAAGLRPAAAVAQQAPLSPRDGAGPPAAASEAATRTVAEPSAAAAPPVERVTHVIRKGETLASVLHRNGILRTEAHRWTQVVGKRYSLRGLYPGRKVVLYLTSEPGKQRTLRALQIESRGRDLRTWQVAGEEIAYRGKNEEVAASELASAPEASTRTVAGPSAAAAPPVERVTHVLRKGETFASVLRGNGIPWTEARRWSRAVGKRYSLRQLYPGRKVVLYLTSEPGKPRTLRALQIESRHGDLLTWQAAEEWIAYRGKDHRVGQVVESGTTAAAPAPAATAPAKAPAAAVESSRLPAPKPPTPSVEPLRKVVRTIGKGQTLGRIFQSLGVSGKERNVWSHAIGKQYPVTKLKPGQRLHLYFDQAPASSRGDDLKAVELEVRKGRKLTWERVGKDIRFGRGQVLGRGRAAVTAAPSDSDGLAVDARKGGGLSEYALAWIKQRNGLLAYAPSPNRNGAGTRPALPLQDAERVTHKLKSGEHLWGVLRRYVLDDEERRLWLTAVQQHKHMRRLRAGSRIHMYFKSSANGNGATASRGDGHFQALEVALRSNLRLTWYRGEQGILFYRDEVPYRQEVKSVSGRIVEGSLYASAKRAGVDVGVISEVVDILGWDIDFRRDLRPGDAYRVLYRRKVRPGSAASAEVHILAVEFFNRGRKHTAVYFEGVDGKGHYYDARGRSVSRSFLRYPLEFRRISSRFSRSRFHPVLKVRRPHLGVDFAARTGTPVRAVGDGRVTRAGWKGGYGRMVEVTHGTSMKTRYAHLRRYGPGVRRGVSVKKGQTIGYVGCSGLCTGPHLHFEMWQNDRYVDPLRAKIPVEHELDPLLMEIFEETRDLFFARLTSDHKTASLFPQDLQDGAD